MNDIMEYYSAFKRDGNSESVTRRVKLEDVPLSVRSQSQGKQCLIPHITLSKIIRLIESENRMVVARGYRKGKEWMVIYDGEFEMNKF